MTTVLIGAGAILKQRKPAAAGDEVLAALQGRGSLRVIGRAFHEPWMLYRTLR